MASVAATARSDRAQVVIGVDTHKDVHVAAALSALGVLLEVFEFPSTRAGTAAVRVWAAGLGEVLTWGVEGTGSWGAGLARGLRAADEHVVEVNQVQRHTRRMLGGKSDPRDAEAAARAVLAGFATATPKSGDGPVEQIRIIRAARSSAVKARTAAMNQLKALIVTAPETLREELTGLTPAALISRCAGLRPAGSDLTSTLKRALRALARRHKDLSAEIKAHTTELTELITLVAPALLSEHGVGPDCAAALLITAGDNPHRLRNEAAFAALCGTSPIPASSGQRHRHRLNRGGDRQANAALHRVVISRLANHPPTRAYMSAHVAPNGANKMHTIRCLKRYLARHLYPLILAATTNPAESSPQPALITP